MFGKNKRPLSDLLNPARRKGGTKGPPARRTKSFIHSLCTCPCLPRSSRAAFLVGWWRGESAGVVFSSFSLRTEPGLVPSRRLRAGLRSPAALGCAGQPRRAAVPRSRLSAAPSPSRGAGAMGRSRLRRLLALRAGERLRSGSPAPGVPAVDVLELLRCLVTRCCLCVWCFSLPPAGVIWGPLY